MGFVYGITSTPLGTLYMDVNGDGKKDKLELVAAEHFKTSGNNFSKALKNRKIIKTEVGVAAVHINTGTAAKPAYSYLNDLNKLLVGGRTLKKGDTVNIVAWRARIKSFYSEGMTTLKGATGKRCANVTLRLAVKAVRAGKQKIIGYIGTRNIKLCIKGKGKNIKLVSSKPPIKQRKKP